MKSHLALLVLGTGLLASPTASTWAAALPVVGIGVLSGSDNTNWVSHGLATLAGATSGVDWTVSGQRENSDWGFVSGTTQGALQAPALEWPLALTINSFGYVRVTQTVLTVGADMMSHVLSDNGSFLLISEVAPAAGDYSLNGVTQSATSVGQILGWISPVASLVVGETMTYDSTVVIGGDTVSSGPIGFSSVPEPSSVALLGVAGMGALGLRRRR